ncbi:MAG: hypothetical protein AAF961_08280 [Planctomycetota bacterium]
MKMTTRFAFVAAGLTLATMSAAVGETLYFEDFAGGDVSHSSVWTDYTGGTSSAAAGDLVLAETPLGMVTAPTGVSAVETLSNVSVRTRVNFAGTPIESAGVAIVANGDASVRNSYYQGGINPDNNNLYINWNEGFDSTNFAFVESGFDFSGGEEIVLQFDVAGNELSLTAWRPGEAMPATPQLQYTDDAVLLPPGIPGLLFDGGGDADASATFRYFHVASQPIPEPATCMLLAAATALAFARVAIVGRR